MRKVRQVKTKANRSNGKARLLAYVATCGIMILAVSAVLVVRAYLTADTDPKVNDFSPKNFTYTDIGINEPGGSTYSISIDNGTKVGTLLSGTKNKTATVTVSEGTDKKPVFIRVTMVMNIYDENGNNIRRKFSQCVPSYNQATATAAKWTEKTAEGMTWYYYNEIVLPGDATGNVFDSVTISCADELPNNAAVKIRVIADAVQAVSIDNDDWTAENYTVDEVKSAWGLATDPDLTYTDDGTTYDIPDDEDLPDELKSQQLEGVTVDWNFSS